MEQTAKSIAKKMYDEVLESIYHFTSPNQACGLIRISCFLAIDYMEKAIDVNWGDIEINKNQHRLYKEVRKQIEILCNG